LETKVEWTGYLFVSSPFSDRLFWWLHGIVENTDLGARTDQVVPLLEAAVRLAADHRVVAPLILIRRAADHRAVAGVEAAVEVGATDGAFLEAKETLRKGARIVFCGPQT